MLDEAGEGGLGSGNNSFSKIEQTNIFFIFCQVVFLLFSTRYKNIYH